jgi:hypothetical protein
MVRFSPLSCAPALTSIQTPEKIDTDNIFKIMRMESTSKPEDFVRTFERSEWDKMTREEQQEFFCRYSVHVKGPPTCEVLPDVTGPSSVEGIRQILDVDREVYCHGEQKEVEVVLFLICCAQII